MEATNIQVKSKESYITIVRFKLMLMTSSPTRITFYKSMERKETEREREKEMEMAV